MHRIIGYTTEHYSALIERMAGRAERINKAEQKARQRYYAKPAKYFHK